MYTYLEKVTMSATAGRLGVEDGFVKNDIIYFLDIPWKWLSEAGRPVGLLFCVVPEPR
jgi:hypothetical protein